MEIRNCHISHIIILQHLQLKVKLCKWCFSYFSFPYDMEWGWQSVQLIELDFKAIKVELWNQQRSPSQARQHIATSRLDVDRWKTCFESFSLRLLASSNWPKCPGFMGTNFWSLEDFMISLCSYDATSCMFIWIQMQYSIYVHTYIYTQIYTLKSQHQYE